MPSAINLECLPCVLFHTKYLITAAAVAYQVKYYNILDSQNLFALATFSNKFFKWHHLTALLD